MSLSQNVKAFSDSSLIKDGKKFEIIDYDACIMSSVEIAAALADYADYLVISPENEPGRGQEYTTWLNAVKNDPSMNGFELSRIIVDAMMEFYTNGAGKGQDATLSVIDVQNFRERLLPSLKALDGLLISEAKNVGSRNNRFNFYDELYSLDESFAYSFGMDSLYDLGNLAGAISVPQSEMNNITQAQINRSENVYTHTALDILSVLRDDDNSGDDVIYARGTEKMKKTVAAGVIRNIDGEVVWPEDGMLKVPITGLSLFFGDDSIDNTESFVGDIPLVSEAVQSGDIKGYLDRRPVAVSYYTLITCLGVTVSRLSDNGEKYINYRKVKKELQDTGTWQSIDKMIVYLVSQGEFYSTDEAEDFLSVIVAQQSKEVISKNKVKVKQIENADGSFTDYHVVVSNTSAQAFMSVNSSVMAHCKNTDTDEFISILKMIYGDISPDQLYPDGINVAVSVAEGQLDDADYYDSYDDTDAQFYQRLYASSSSVWSVPRTKETCFVLYDGDGSPHLADIRYLDKSYETAYVPIIIYNKGEGDSPDKSYCAYLYISKENGIWQINGLTYSNDDGAERSYSPMDSDIYKGARFSTTTRIADAIYYYETGIPISSFADIDITKEKWGITFGEMPISELDDVQSYDAHYFIEDVYGYGIDITDRFDLADEAAQNGDLVHDINMAQAVVEPAFYNGLEQKPAVTLSLNGKELVETEDYKVIYLGYVRPGEAYLAVLGIGDFIGTAYIPFEIRELQLLGDVDSDGSVTILDATFIQRYLAAFALPFELLEISADADEDGEISIIDATHIQRWLVSLPCNNNIGKPIKQS